MVEKISHREGLGLGTARSVGKRLSHRATGAPFQNEQSKHSGMDVINDLTQSHQNGTQILGVSCFPLPSIIKLV